ncbi:siderophore biosynthesis protein SbnG [bacterium LRH843]|nr:siderophore biosynthesis protein SbnG [bacterium LRH843]
MNKLKKILDNSQTAYGIFTALKEPAIIEIIGYAGYDFAVIDLEHSTMNLSTMENMIRAAQVVNITSVVRTPQDDYGTILRAVEAGADAVMVPHVTTREQAEKIVAMAKYQPIGQRGIDASTRVAKFGGISVNLEDHMQTQNERIAIIGMIEDAEAVQNIEEIVTADGLDLLFIGPSDLSASYGFPGQVRHPIVQDAIQEVIDKANKAGVKVGIPAFEPSQVKEVIGMGASYVTTPAVEASYLTQALKAHLESIKLS